MKWIAVILLIALGVYLYRRAQRLAVEEINSHLADKEILAANKRDETQLVQDASHEKSASDIEIEVAVALQSEPISALKVEPTSVLMPEASEARFIQQAEPNSVQDAESEPTSESATKPAPASTAKSVAKSESIVVNQGAVELSWSNAKLAQVVSKYQDASETSVKHLALLGVLAECYKQRKQRQYREYGASLTTSYLKLFGELKSPSTEKGMGFMQLSSLLVDCGQFESSIDVCQQAISYGLTDGTVTGFEGRIARLEKAKVKADVQDVATKSQSIPAKVV